MVPRSYFHTILIQDLRHIMRMCAFQRKCSNTALHLCSRSQYLYPWDFFQSFECISDHFFLMGCHRSHSNSVQVVNRSPKTDRFSYCLGSSLEFMGNVV